MYYGPKILIKAGVTVGDMSDKQAAVLLNIPLALTNGIGTFFSIICIEKAGRRFLMLRTLPVAGLAMVIVSAGMGM